VDLDRITACNPLVDGLGGGVAPHLPPDQVRGRLFGHLLPVREKILGVGLDFVEAHRF